MKIKFDIEKVYLVSNSKDYFIYSECVNCPEIGYIAYKSFQEKYPDLILNLYLCSIDYNYLKDKLSEKNFNYHILSDDSIKCFNKSGHLGTAILWSKVILNNDLPNKIIHFDSDIYFRGNKLLHNIIDYLDNYDLVGAPRSYKLNPCSRDDCRDLPDLVQTFCFGFNKNKINLDKIDKNNLYKYIQGNTLDNKPTIDFFDPISRDILNNGGKIHIINIDLMGGYCNEKGNRDNKYNIFNHWFDVGDEIIHFASVGSGINFYKAINKNIKIDVPQGYIDYALSHYKIWKYLFEDNDIDLEEAFKEVIFRGHPVTKK